MVLHKKSCVFLAVVCPDGEGLLLLYLQIADAYTKRFMPQNGQVAILKCSPVWMKMRESLKTLSELKPQVDFQLN